MWLDYTDESVLASSDVIGLLILHGVLLQRAEIAHLLIKPSSQQSQAYHTLAVQLLRHRQALLEIIRILIGRKIPHLGTSRVEAFYFRLDAIEVTHYSTYVGGVSVLGPVEVIGSPIAKDDVT